MVDPPGMANHKTITSITFNQQPAQFLGSTWPAISIMAWFSMNNCNNMVMAGHVCKSNDTKQITQHINMFIRFY